MTVPPLSKRTRLLEAAGHIIQTEGIERLTLDAVARVAAVSKGGLLYHFPSKDALISGLIDHLIQQFDLALQYEFDHDPMPTVPGRWMRAYVRASIPEDGDTNVVSAGLLAAVATNPSLLAPLRERFLVWQEQAEQDGLDPAFATLIRLAVDGLWLTNLCGFAPQGTHIRQHIRERLLLLSQEPRG